MKRYTLQTSTTVIIPAGSTSITPWGFTGCLMETITIPTTVTAIGNFAFYYCSKLISVTIPNGVKTIGIIFIIITTY